MTGGRREGSAVFHILQKCFFDFISEINKIFISAFSNNAHCSVIKINIRNIQTNAFRHTDSGAKKESDDSKVTYSGLFVALQLLFREFFAGIHLIQQLSNFIGL